MGSVWKAELKPDCDPRETCKDSFIGGRSVLELYCGTRGAAKLGEANC